MKKLFFSLFLFTFYINFLFGADTIRVVFIGDIMHHLPQKVAAKTDDGTYNYKPSFELIKSEISKADFAVANFEITLAGKPYTGYPCFSAPDAVADAVKYMGIDLVTNANNHCCDRGKKGIARTLSVFDSINIETVGTYRNLAEKQFRYPLIINKNNIRLAFISYTYGTNGMPIIKPAIVNLIDTLQISKDIKQAKKSEADVIICLIHWGDEYMLKQNKNQEMLAKYMISHGVKLIIGSHPHVVQPMIANADSVGKINSVVVYSLGNVISNQNSENTDVGAIAYINLVKNNGETNILDASYRLIWRYRTQKNGKQEFFVLPVNEYYDKKSFFPENEFVRFRQIIDKTRKRLKNFNLNFEEKTNRSQGRSQTIPLISSKVLQP